MARIWWESGRFTINWETQEIYRGLRDWQRFTGDQIQYFRFAYDQSNKDSVYGEATGPNGRMYFGPIILPCLHVVHTESAVEELPEGFTYHDRLHATASFDQLKKLGMEQMDLNTQNFLKDRIVYDDKVFRVYNVQILGQIQQKDIIVTFDATQLKPEDMQYDVQFAAYSNVPEAIGEDAQTRPVDTLAANKQLAQIYPNLNGPGVQ